MEASGRALILEPKQFVERGGQQYQIIRVIDLDVILAKNCANGKLETLLIQDLQPLASLDQYNQDHDRVTELPLVSEPDWVEARHRYSIILPLLKVSQR